MKISMATGTLSALALAVGVAFNSPAVAGEVEVLHWWTSGGEAKSVGELKKILESKGDKWKDFAVAGGAGETAMTVLKSRVVSGRRTTKRSARSARKPFDSEVIASNSVAPLL